jgi:hypothetical protein
MSKVSISEFVIAVFDLVEAEGRTLKDSAAVFIENQQINLKKTISKSSWIVGLIFIAIACILAAIAFFIFGCYKVFLIFLPAFIAPFAVSLLLLVIAGIFSYFALRKVGNADK